MEKKFRSYCSDQMKLLSYKYSANGKFTAFDYRQLSRVCLASCSTFNARRGPETSKLTLSQWTSVEDNQWKRSTELQNLDDPVEKALSERLQLCYVPGNKKMGKSVLIPIFFTEEVVAAIKILNKERDLAGISKQNEFVFANSGEGRLKAWDVLQGVSRQIEGLENPELLTLTRFRKYLATMLQPLDMSNADLTWITNHLGHTKGTHLAWYQKESSTIELTKMARVLTAVDQGGNLKKRKIDELGQTQGNSQHLEQAEDDNQPTQESEETDQVADEIADHVGDQVDDETNNQSSCELVPKKKRKAWVPWSVEEVKAIKKGFMSHIISKKYPQQHEVLTVLKHYPILRERGPKKVRDKVVNMIRAAKED